MWNMAHTILEPGGKLWDLVYEQSQVVSDFLKQ